MTIKLETRTKHAKVMSNIQIESDLKDLLNKLDQKLDQIDSKFEQKLNNIDNKIEQTRPLSIFEPSADQKLI